MSRFIPKQRSIGDKFADSITIEHLLLRHGKTMPSGRDGAGSRDVSAGARTKEFRTKTLDKNTLFKQGAEATKEPCARTAMVKVNKGLSKEKAKARKAAVRNETKWSSSGGVVDATKEDKLDWIDMDGNLGSSGKL